MSTRTYTVELPLSQGPDLVDAMTMVMDGKGPLSPEERVALSTLLTAVERRYNAEAEEDNG